MLHMETTRTAVTASFDSFLRRQPHVTFPNAYVWFVLMSALDVMVTWCVLSAGGVELNHLADVVIRYWGMHGLVLYKFCLVAFVVIMCENIARRRLHTGRALAIGAVGLTCLPVFFGLGQMLGVVHLG